MSIETACIHRHACILSFHCNRSMCASLFIAACASLFTSWSAWICCTSHLWKFGWQMSDAMLNFLSVLKLIVFWLHRFPWLRCSILGLTDQQENSPAPSKHQKLADAARIYLAYSAAAVGVPAINKISCASRCYSGDPAWNSSTKEGHTWQQAGSIPFAVRQLNGCFFVLVRTLTFNGSIYKHSHQSDTGQELPFCSIGVDHMRVWLTSFAVVTVHHK